MRRAVTSIGRAIGPLALALGLPCATAHAQQDSARAARSVPAAPAALVGLPIVATDGASLAGRGVLGGDVPANELRVGDTVTVAGRALVSSGVLQPRGTYIAIQGDAGSVWVFRRQATMSVREGDSVRARGALLVYRGSLEVMATSIEVVPTSIRGPTPPDSAWPEGGFREGRLMRLRGAVGARGESEGGRWVRLRRAPSAQGRRDSVTMWVPWMHGDAPDLSDVEAGDMLDVTGVITVYRDNPGDASVWQIVPRRADDVRTIGIPRSLYRWLAQAGAGLLVVGVLVVAATRLLTRRQGRALRETEARYQQLLALSPDAVLVHDGERVLFANAAAARLLGVANESALARRPIDTFVGPDERVALGAAAHRRGAGHRAQDAPPSAPEPASASVPRRRIRTLFRAADGTVVDVEVATSPCRYLDRDAAVIVARDIGPQLRYERELRELALLDELTGLHNRRGFFLFAEAELRRLRERGSHAVLVFADLDGLKEINDRHGHAAGDQALRAVARALREVVGEQGLAARWSGDEFVALVPDATPAAPPISTGAPVVNGDHLNGGSGDGVAAEAFEQRLGAAVARHVRSSDAYRVSASVGARRLGPDASETLAAALAAADAGLYRRRGRARAMPVRD